MERAPTLGAQTEHRNGLISLLSDNISQSVLIAHRFKYIFGSYAKVDESFFNRKRRLAVFDTLT